jgi:hypothetical protein
MKRLFLLLVLVTLLSGCAATSMIVSERSADLTPSPDKALLVVIRDTSFGFAIVFWNYLDGKLIGETKGNTYLVTPVDLGKHYLMVTSENTATAQMDFKPGKIYYVREGVTMGLWRARTTGFSPLTPQEAKEAMAGCTYWELDPKNSVGDMDPKLYQQAIADYHEEVKQNPQGFKSILEYQGY